MTPPIADTYHDHMRLGLHDKLFFLEHIGDVDCFVDFGCGDGSLLLELKLRTGKHTIGIELDRRAHRLALVGSGVDQLFFHPDALPHLQPHKSGCLIMSSVLHEVLSQGDDGRRCLEALAAHRWDYIVIRDFGINSADPAVVGQVERMMKAPWKDDPREHNETYLHASPGQIVSSFGEDGGGFGPYVYNPVYFRHYRYAPAAKVIEEAVGHHFNWRTHFQLVLERSRDAVA